MSASSSKKRKGKDVENFEYTAFVSEEAQKMYDESVERQNAIPERDLCVTVVWWRGIVDNIKPRKWEMFCV